METTVKKESRFYDDYLRRLYGAIHMLRAAPQTRYTATQARILNAVETARQNDLDRYNRELIAEARRLETQINDAFNRLGQITARCDKQKEQIAEQRRLAVKAAEAELDAALQKDVKILTSNPGPNVSDSSEFNAAFQKLILASKRSTLNANPLLANVAAAKEIAQIFDEIDAAVDAYAKKRERLIRERDFTLLSRDRDAAFFRRRSDGRLAEINDFFARFRNDFWQKLRENERTVVENLTSPPIAPDKARRFFEILADPVYQTEAAVGRRELTKGITEICASEKTRFDGLPIAVAECRLPGEAQTFKAPASLDQDAFYFVDRGRSDEQAVRDFLQNVVFQALRNNEVASLDICVVDPEFLGDFYAPFNRGLSERETANFETQVVVLEQEFGKTLDKLQEHVAATVQTLTPGETLRERNASNAGVKENRKLLIVNSASLFYGNYRAKMDEAIVKLCALANNARRCGVTVVCCGDGEFWTRFEELSPLGFGEITRLELGDFSPATLKRLLPFDAASVAVDRVEALKVDAEQIERLIRFIDVSIGEINDALDFEEELGKVGRAQFGFLSGKEIRVPLGRNMSGAVVEWICSSGGDFPGQTIIVGGTGSGKSNLLHVAITTAGYFYAPNELEFYLIDLKQGVEFQRYAKERLPQAKLIATEGDVEVALGALRDVAKSFEKRSEIFRRAGVADLTEYRNERPDEILPRVVVVIDEFHNLFAQDEFKAEAGSLINKIITEGRAAGYHLVLATQNLTQVNRQIIDNVSTRIALKCEENALNGLFASSREAAAEHRKLKRTGEAILCAQNKVERFRCPYVDKATQTQYLKKIGETARERGVARTPLVYDGGSFPQPAGPYYENALAMCRDNNEFRLLLGESSSLTSGVFHTTPQRYGANFLLVEESTPCRAAIYQTLARSFNFRQSVAPFDVYLHDEAGKWAPEFDMPKDRFFLTNAYEKVGESIFKVYDRFAEREKGADDRTRIWLILTQVELLRGLERMTRKTDRRADETVEPRGTGRRRDLSALTTPTFSSSFASDDAANAQEALVRILRDGGRYGVHALIACNALRLALSNMNVRSSEVGSLFDAVVCMNTSDENSQLALGSSKAKSLNARRAIYYNMKETTTFRPYLELKE